MTRATSAATVVSLAALLSCSSLLLLVIMPFAPAAAGDVTDMVATKPVLKSDSMVDPRLLAAGGKIILSTDIQSLLNETSTFAVIMEMRDSNGVMQFLDWQFGLIRPESPADIGFGWTP